MLALGHLLTNTQNRRICQAKSYKDEYTCTSLLCNSCPWINYTANICVLMRDGVEIERERERREEAVCARVCTCACTHMHVPLYLHTPSPDQADFKSFSINPCCCVLMVSRYASGLFCKILLDMQFAKGFSVIHVNLDSPGEELWLIYAYSLSLTLSQLLQSETTWEVVISLA